MAADIETVSRDVEALRAHVVEVNKRQDAHLETLSDGHAKTQADLADLKATSRVAAEAMKAQAQALDAVSKEVSGLRTDAADRGKLYKVLALIGTSIAGVITAGGAIFLTWLANKLGTDPDLLQQLLASPSPIVGG